MKKSLIFTVLFLIIGNSLSFSQIRLILPDEDTNCNVVTKYNGSTITFQNPISLTSSSQTIRVNLEFSSTQCTQTLSFIKLPVWITVGTNNSSYVDFIISENISSSTRNATLAGRTSGAIGMLIPISITQAGGIGCNGIDYYTDSDGDGFGDVFAFPENSCSPIANKVTNNLDTCPTEPYPTNNGCPPVAENLNWTQSKSYDIKGNILSSSKEYFDELGRGIQTQTYDIKEKRIWAIQTMYDYAGRQAFNTLSAPITNKNSSEIFQYKNGFIKKSNNTDFTVADFENSNIYNPATIGVQNNTLGKYYSSTNTDELFQDKTDRPYSRTIYSKLIPGAVKQTVGGNKINNEWKQGYSFSMNAAQEMYYVFGYNYFESSPAIASTFSSINNILNDSSKQIVWTKVNKSVVEDVHGNETVSFTNDDGKLLANARSGGLPENQGGPKQYQIVSLIGAQKYIDIHLPKGCEGTLSFFGSTSLYKVYDLKTEQIVSNINNLSAGFYRVEYIGNSTANKASALTYINKSNKVIYPVISSSFGVRYNVNYYDYSLNYYNKAGSLISNLQPLGFDASCLNTLSATVNHNSNLKSSYTYNSLGQLLATNSPDEGTANFKYREDGQIRFSQNSKQTVSAGKEYSYTNYDELGRPIESGVAYKSAGMSIWEFTQFFQTDPNVENFNASKKERHFTVYDENHDLEIATMLLNANISSSGYNQSYVAGNVSKTYNRDISGALVSSTYYSYDIYGRVKWVIQNTNGLGVKTIDYEYDSITGQVLKVLYQKNTPSEKFIHRYSYNTSQELVKVETSTDDIEYVAHADYSYYETGALKRTEIANGLQGIDYIYNLSGQLKAINHPDLTAASDPGGDATDLFGMVIDYYNGDYSRNSNFSMISSGTNQFNGNIKGITSNTKWSNGIPTPAQYRYQYNHNNWLKEANFSGGNASANDDYKVHNITYDANGNIKTLSRNKNTDSSGNLMDQFTYHYQSGTSNRLDHIDDAITINTNTDDLKDQNVGNYTYNSIGQLIEDREHVTPSTPNDIVRYEYNASGLVTRVTKNNIPVVKFVYNDKDFRIRKISYANGIQSGKTDYVRDASGSVLAIYQDNILVENPIYGASRLGIYKKQTNTSLYQLADHLGNVRAVLSKQHGQRISVTDFNNGSTTPWIASGTATIAVDQGRLKITTNTDLHGTNGYYSLQGNNEYEISIEVDKTNFDGAPLEFSIWKDNVLKQSQIVENNGVLHTTFSPSQTGTYRFNFRLREDNYNGSNQIVYIDNVVINKVIQNGTIAITNATDYYPFGMPMPNRQVVGGEPYRYAYQGQEKDPETGKEAFQLRLWDGRTGRWLTTDPKGEFHSPYLGMGNNPISKIDPDGGSTVNPIYGSDGTFRGVDEFGLQGEAIVYDGAFTNGMSQSKILKNGGSFLKDWIGSDAFSVKSFMNIFTHHLSLPDRPDYDGIVTFLEAREFSKNGGGDLYIDISKMDFKSVKEFGVWDFKNGDVQVINFFSPYNQYYKNKKIIYRPAIANSTLSFVYGRLKFKMLDVHTGSIGLMTGHLSEAPNAFDRFDFANPFFHWLAGSGKAINFYGYGTGQINTTLDMGSLWNHPVNSKRRH